MKKGQAEIVENVITILFGIIILAAITTIAYNIYTSQLGDEIENNLKQIGVDLSKNILKLYETGKNSEYSPGTNESVKLAELDLKLPSQVSGRNYEVILVEANPLWIQVSNITIGGQFPVSVVTVPGAKVILRTTQSPIVSVEYEFPNIDVPVEGRSENGLDSNLAYYRYDFDGVEKDSIVLGGYDIIIDTVSVS